MQRAASNLVHLTDEFLAFGRFLAEFSLSEFVADLYATGRVHCM